MSDRDAAPEPVDKAYIQAEATLSDDAARAARRARVLGAIAQETVTPLASSSSAARRQPWRRGGWLVAASVAGLGVFVAIHVYQPAPFQPRSATPTHAAPVLTAQNPAARTVAALPTSPARAPSQTPAPAARTFAGAPPAAAPSSPDINPVGAPLAPPPALELPPAPREPPPPPADVVVAGERRAPTPAENYPGLLSGRTADDAANAQSSARSVAKPATIPTPAPPPTRSESSAALASDQAAKLRAAAAVGRTIEIEALLAQGVPVDAQDAGGNTALMKSIQADHIAASALLRRHGASLDHENHAGESARDMAIAKGDVELNQAIGLDP